MSGTERSDLLGQWDELLVRVARAERDPLPWPVREAGTTLRVPADEVDVAALEARLGVALPASYRSFLLRSDGAWAQPGWGLAGHRQPPEIGAGLDRLGLLDTGQVGWFRDRDTSYVHGWTGWDTAGDGPAHPVFGRPVPEVHYLDHEGPRDEHKFGHLLYALQISGDIDGYTILLNPLLTDPDGEWEAWDFGSKTLGGIRYRSFGALLAAQLPDLQRPLARAASVDFDALERTARDREAADTDRRRGFYGLCYAGEGRRIIDVLLAEADPSVETNRRQTALGLLGRIEDERALPALIAASTDPEPRIRSAVLGDLAANPHPAARRAAVTMLTRPDEEDFVLSSVYSRGAEAVYQAWSLTGSHRLLEMLAYCGDVRAVPPLAEAVLDTTIPSAQYSRLVMYSSRPGDPAMVPVLAQAAELSDAPLVSIGRALLRLGARDEAAAVLSRAVHGQGGNDVAADLGLLNHPVATAALVERCAADPTQPILWALGWTHGQAAVDALTTVAADQEAPRDLRLAAVDGLERIRDASAADTLALLASQGRLDAVRALARRRDRRALPHLTSLLHHPDDDLAFEAVDGLRDLRDLSTAPALLRIVTEHANTDIIAAAASALLMIRAPQAEQALRHLDTGGDDLRRLSRIWRSR